MKLETNSRIKFKKHHKVLKENKSEIKILQKKYNMIMMNFKMNSKNIVFKMRMILN
jgi:hypothetical protein